jgi:hypothetical protein
VKRKKGGNKKDFFDFSDYGRRIESGEERIVWNERKERGALLQVREEKKYFVVRPNTCVSLL